MGACCSKTDTTVTSTPIQPELQPEKKKNTAVAIIASSTEPETLKKDVFVVKNRKSHELDRHPDQEIRKSVDWKKTPNLCPNSDISKLAGDLGKVVSMGEMVRTSSCTKEEVDAILIQCGRLSRSSSGVNPAGGETPTRGRRYSGSKRSFDFDDDEVAVSGDPGRRQREPRVSSPSSSRRRSRERDPQQQRSGSKERGSGSGSGGRRVSRSPNRRSESPVPNSTGTAAVGGGGGNRPGKMVSVPATDKTNNAGGGEVVGAGVSGGVKKIQVKRTTGEAAVARPATVRVLNENQNPQPLTLSRSNSPHRRNPLGEIDNNVVVGSEQPGSKKPNGEKTMNNKTDQNVSRTRSSRLSRDLDINLEGLINANPNPKPNPNPPSYASLLLEDIQNFHQKNPSACLNKVCTSSNDRQLMVNDDMMEPSLHKYVTVRRGGGDADTEEQESSGSNSFAGSQQLSWMSSSWEPNSGDSTDCWTSKSRSDVEFEKSGEYPRNGIGRGRVGVHGRSAYTLPNNGTVGSA